MIENAPELADIALQAAEAAETNESDVAVAENYAEAAAAISVGLAALASGYAERGSVRPPSALSPRTMICSFPGSL